MSESEFHSENCQGTHQEEKKCPCGCAHHGKPEGDKAGCAHSHDDHHTHHSHRIGCLAPSVGLGSAIVVALSHIPCCGVPLVAFLLNTCGLTVGEFSFLQPIQMPAMILGVMALVYGYYREYYAQPCPCGCEETEEERPTVTTSRVILWVATVLSLFLIITSSLHIGCSHSAQDCNHSHCHHGVDEVHDSQ